MAANFGYVKIKRDRKDASVSVDGGFADKVEKAKKFALRPGNHNIELRDSDGRTLYKEQWRSSSAKQPSCVLAKTVVNGDT